MDRTVGCPAPGNQAVAMTWADADHLHRTAKQFLDSGVAKSPMEASEILNRFVLQVSVGPAVERDPAAQAALLTVVNAGHRAFLGGVHVTVDSNPNLSIPWALGDNLTDAIVRFGGSVVDRIDAKHPTLVVGNPRQLIAGEIVLYTTWSGWSGGVVDSPGDANSEPAMPLAGVAAGAIGVSEAFQYLVGHPTAGRRDVGVSLWQPHLHWRDRDAVGPPVRHLPTGLWLLGLGHLGQAYAWALGCLPYATPSAATFYLVDIDTIIDGNHATGLLTRLSDVNRLKTRVVAERLEELGSRARIVERRFDTNTHPGKDEPAIALAGFDHPAPRRLLGDRFDRVVDAGLGGGPVEYLDMLLHTFPSPLDPSTTFQYPSQTRRPLPAAYAAEIQRLVDQGSDAGDAKCGMVELAGVTVGAAFVGANAGALAVADVLRWLHDGPEYSVLALDLRSPDHIAAILNNHPGGPSNPGYTAAR